MSMDTSQALPAASRPSRSSWANRPGIAAFQGEQTGFGGFRGLRKWDSVSQAIST